MRVQRSEATSQFYKEVGLKIAKCRKAADLAQQDLAARSNLTRTSIVNIEKGRQQVFLHTIVDLAKVLSVPVTDLIPSMQDIDHQLMGATAGGKDWLKLALSEEGAGDGRS